MGWARSEEEECYRNKATAEGCGERWPILEGQQGPPFFSQELLGHFSQNNFRRVEEGGCDNVVAGGVTTSRLKEHEYVKTVGIG